MAETDALGSFDFDQVSKPGLFLKFQADKPITMRVLTIDPVLQQQEFTDKVTGEISLNTKFNFIVYNFTDGRAQIWSATAAMARKVGDLHKDPDFGSNIRNLDIKITPTGEGKERRYDIQVLPQARQLTNDQIKEAQGINLDEVIEHGTRMSIWKKPKDGAAERPRAKEEREAAEERYARGQKTETEPEAEPTPEEQDAIAEVTEEPINLDDIPF